MTQHTVHITLALALLLICTGVAAPADTLTITATRAEVRAGPDVKRAMLSTVSQGATFSLLETRKGWVAQAAARVQGERGFFVTLAATVTAQARTALVIGNAAYSADAARGSLIAYATSPGKVASDGEGRNGAYTKHLLRYLPTPDLVVEVDVQKSPGGCGGGDQGHTNAVGIVLPAR